MSIALKRLPAAKRVLNQPQKQPVMQAERPWEQKGIPLDKVLYDRDRQRFRLWYTAQADTVIGTRVLVQDNPPRKVHESHICYAESADGVHWERPALDIVERERYPGNNICMPSMRPPGRTFLSHLVDDPFADDPQQRFKMIYLDQADEGAVGGGLAPDQRLRWRGSGDVRSLIDKMVALQFSFLPGDKLYSYTLRVES